MGWFCGSVLALSASVAIRSACADTTHLALVIGNASYTSLPALPACAASAHVVAAALRRSGFDVAEKMDLSNGEMAAAIRQLAHGLGAGPDRRGVLYVCSYAVDLDGRDFLLPSSASIDRDTDVLTQGLTAKSSFDTVARSGALAGLVLFDAVASPKGSGALRFEGITRAPLPSFGFAAKVSANPPAQGATPFAAAFAEVLAPSKLEVGRLLRALATRLDAGAITTLALALPTGPAWLAGAPSALPPAVPAPPAAPPAPVAQTPAKPAPAPAAAAPFPDEEHMTEADRRRIQAELLRLGYYDQAIDGIFGAETRAAIRRFQHEISATMTGLITPEQAARLITGLR